MSGGGHQEVFGVRKKKSKQVNVVWVGGFFCLFGFVLFCLFCCFLFLFFLEPCSAVGKSTVSDHC